jgi:hypothetical protein
MFLATLLLSLAVNPAEAAMATSFRADHMGEPEALCVAMGRDGRALSLIGRFDIGLDERSVHQSDLALKAAVAFVNRHYSSFGLKAPYRLELQATRHEAIDDKTLVIHAEQHADGLRLLGSEVTVTLHADGALHSINGYLREPAAWAQDPSLTVEDVAQRLGEAVPALAGKWSPRTSALGRNYAAADGRTLERAIDPRAGGVVWRTRNGAEEVVLDEATLAVRRISTDDHVRGSCSVRHSDFPRSGGQATTMASLSGTAVESPTCEALSFFPNDCFWQLKLDELFTTHAIARIVDTNDTQTERHQACDSTPSFGSTSGDFLQQQTAYVSIQGMRHFMLDNVWRVAPNRDSKVEVRIDSGEPGAGGAFFRDTGFAREIHMSPGASSFPDTYWHEYGHYVVWTYDDVSNNCDTGEDEGDAIDETLANVFGFLNALDDPDVNPTYAAVEDFANQAPAPHTGAGNRLTLGSCTADEHDMGVAFEQAVWELLWNRNCESTVCPNPVTFGNTIFPGASRETVLRNVGEALGFALRSLGQNITFSQVAAQMRDRVRAQQGAAAGNRFGAVLSHHGF